MIFGGIVAKVNEINESQRPSNYQTGWLTARGLSGMPLPFWLLSLRALGYCRGVRMLRSSFLKDRDNLPKVTQTEQVWGS